MEQKKTHSLEELATGMEVLLLVEVVKDLFKELDVPANQSMHCLCILLIETARKNELTKPHLLRNVSVLWEAIDSATNK